MPVHYCNFSPFAPFFKSNSFYNYLWLLLLLLSHFSRVRLSVTPYMAAHQAPPSLGFSRQEYWSGWPFPSPVYACMHAKMLQSCPTLCDPMDSSPPGSSVHGILWVRRLVRPLFLEENGLAIDMKENSLCPPDLLMCLLTTFSQAL